MVIHFYRVEDDYGFFSNFSAHSIKLDGYRWQTTEHYFQAKKFEGTPHEAEVRRAPTPGNAARMGRSRKRPCVETGSRSRSGLCTAPVRQVHPARRAATALLDTGDARLVEHTDRDRYWGDGGDGRGRNRLGHLLMRLRDALRSEAEG